MVGRIELTTTENGVVCRVGCLFVLWVLVSVCFVVLLRVVVVVVAVVVVSAVVVVLVSRPSLLPLLVCFSLPGPSFLVFSFSLCLVLVSHMDPNGSYMAAKFPYMDPRVV